MTRSVDEGVSVTLRSGIRGLRENHVQVSVADNANTVIMRADGIECIDTLLCQAEIDSLKFWGSLMKDNLVLGNAF